MLPCRVNQEPDIKAQDQKHCRSDHIPGQVRCQVENESQNRRDDCQRQRCYFADESNNLRLMFIVA